ncbi:uncharacterized protein LOC131618867 [Vicia villosa]|uniref:uncharacterized protein LOC131618867 n=1 Tax=Vicia villosa TaxID=3911 RepID=UPI00273AE59E|nr:uncharacterized protein LOC131618867 [Vicia villosa]
MANAKQWDTDAVRDLFDASDTNKILQIPLLEEVKKDRMIWKEEQDGIYSVRTSYKLWYRAVRSREEDIKSLIFYIYSKEGKEVSGRFAVMIDVIWKNKNDYVGHNEKEEATNLALKAMHIWNDWFQAQEDSTNNDRPHHALEWSPPSVGWLKCNVDVDFNNNNDTTNRGWCVRNHLGNFIYTSIAWDPGTLPVFEAEALALKEVILGAISSHLEFLIFESHFQIVTQAIHSNRKGDSEFCLIIESIGSLLHSFPNFEVKFVK